MRMCAIGGLTLMLVSWASAQAQEVTSPPAFKVGDTWTYTRSDEMNPRAGTRKVTETVTTVSDAGIETSVEGMKAGPHRYTKEGNTLRYGGTDYEPMVRYYAFPLSPGKTFEASFSHVESRNIHNTVYQTRQVRVVGWETVKTPAGEFKALKLVATGESGESGIGRGRSRRATEVTVWYSPDVRWFVRKEYKRAGARDETQELISYKLAQ